MAKLTRRGFIAARLAAGTVRGLPQMAAKTGERRILALVHVNSVKAMCAVERVVP